MVSEKQPVNASGVNLATFKGLCQAPLVVQRYDWGAARIARRPSCRSPGGSAGDQKISPEVFEVAAANRDWTSAQFTTFQNALT